MAPVCKGLCIDFKVRRFEGGLRYQNGVKWCRACSRFVQTTLVRCTCCNSKLRVRAKNRIYQRKLKMKNEEMSGKIPDMKTVKGIKIPIKG
ncbi:MAG: hypothetical protein PVG23_02600 [Nitrosopumilaceae archaeon]